MELDELKNTWELLNLKLEEDKSLKEALILEVIRTKADKSVSKLVNYDILSFVILILLIPCIAYAYSRYSGQFNLWDIYTIYAMLVCISGIGWYMLKIRILMKVDLSQKISENIYYTNRYNIWIKREKLLMNMIVGPVFPILAIFMLFEMNAGAYLWLGVISLFVLALVSTYWSYKRIYEKNISSILKSLGEIKDLEEKD